MTSQEVRVFEIVVTGNDSILNLPKSSRRSPGKPTFYHNKFTGKYKFAVLNQRVLMNYSLWLFRGQVTPGENARMGGILQDNQLGQSGLRKTKACGILTYCSCFLTAME